MAVPPPHRSESRRPALPPLFAAGVMAAFFLSGAASLSHEIAWTRLLRLVVGNTTYAITTVLAVFMGGLALGGWLGGRLADRRSDALRLFGWMECGIGLYCLALPWLIGAAGPLYRLVYGVAGGSVPVVIAVRIVTCALVLMVPATLMGATLPILSRHFLRAGGSLGRSVGRLYAINTLGAVTGTAAAGFVLIPTLGVRGTIGLAAAGNVLAGLAGLALHRRYGRVVAAAVPAAQRADEAPGALRRLRRLLMGAYAASGFAALTYEIAWTRVLSLMIGSSVYAFSIMLSAFILGLGLGGLLIARFADRLRDPVRVLAVLQLGIAGSALAAVPLFDSLPFHTARLLSRFGGSFWSQQAAELGMVLAVMLVPTTLMGAAFPVVCRAYAPRDERAGRDVGNLYAANTTGSILGALGGGFLLIPLVGLQTTLQIAVAVNVGIAAVLLLRGVQGRPSPARVALAGVAVLAVGGAWVGIPRWDPAAMAFGPFEYVRNQAGDQLPDTATLRRNARAGRVLYHSEGVATTVTVRELEDGTIVLLVNGKPDASSKGDLDTQILLGQLPALLHPDPRRTLVIGLASGITLASIATHPVETLECAEISPSVVEACRFFDPYNGRVLDDPRTEILVADGRNHLALTDRRYDLIVSEPSNPWIAGVSDLFTLEFFRAVHDRLAAGGVACVWLETYNVDVESFRSVAASFAEVFDGPTLWSSTRADFMLIGSRGGLSVDLAVLERRMARPAVAADLERISVHSPATLLGRMVMDGAGLDAFVEGARLHTDDNALLEFDVPRNRLGRIDVEAPLQAIEAARSMDFAYLRGADAAAVEAAKRGAVDVARAAALANRAMVHFAQGRPDRGREDLRQAATLNPRDPIVRGVRTANLEAARKLAAEGRLEQALTLYQAIVDVHPDHRGARRGIAALYDQLEMPRQALLHYRWLDEHGAKDPRVLFRLAEVSAAAEPAAAVGYYRRLMEQNPDQAVLLNNLARLFATRPALEADPDEVLRLAERACELTQRRNPQALDTLGMVHAAAGRFDDADRCAREALALVTDPDAPLRDELQSRIELYEQGRPYVEGDR